MNYNLKKVEKGHGIILDSNMSTKSKEAILKQFELIASKKPLLNRNCFHVSLAVGSTEKISDDDFIRIGNTYLKEMGFNETQYLMIRHFDTEHPHIHIIANRVDYNGNVVSESHNRYRTQLALREIEKEYNLEKVENSFSKSRNKKERNVTKGEITLFERTGEYSKLIKLEAILKNGFKISKNISEFIQNLNREKVGVYFNIKDDKVLGVSYNYEAIAVKGRNMGDNYKWETLKTHFNYEQIKPTKTILQSNERERRRAEQEGVSIRISSKAIEAAGIKQRVNNNKRREIDGFSKTVPGNRENTNPSEKRTFKNSGKATFESKEYGTNHIKPKEGARFNSIGADENQNQKSNNTLDNISHIINDMAYHLNQIDYSSYYFHSEEKRKKKKKGNSNDRNTSI